MPAVIIFVSAIIITGIIVVIIPKFQELYASSGKELPAITMSLIKLSAAMRTNWYVYIGAVIAGVFAIRAYITSEKGRQEFDQFLIGAPIIGTVVQKSSVARMSRTLSTLLSSGINIIEAIDIASKTAGNYVIEKALADCKESVTVGKPFNAPLSKKKEIPQMVSQMVTIGEQSGTLDTMLAKVADFYEEDVEVAVKAMTTLIEPILMVFLGGIIAFIMIAMYMPIFQMGDAIAK